MCKPFGLQLFEIFNFVLFVYCRISKVSLSNIGSRDEGFGLATSVEQCACPSGYKGLSCEECAPGYTRSSEGLYLGFCQPCECFDHSSICHSETGVCLVSWRVFIIKSLENKRDERILANQLMNTYF